MNMNQLRYFQAVCQQESVTKAAGILHISQPSISNALKNLEAELQVSLFIRDHKKLTLTQTGEFLLEKANCLLNLFDQLPKDVKSFDENNQYTAKIGVSVPDIKIFEQLFTKLHISDPQVQFDFQEYSKHAIKTLIEDETLDFGIIFLEPEDEKTFSYIILMDMRIHPETSSLFSEGKEPLPDNQNAFCYKIGLIWQKKKMPGSHKETPVYQLQTFFLT